MLSFRGLISVENAGGQCAGRYFLSQIGIAQNTAGTITSNNTQSTSATFGDLGTFTFSTYTWNVSSASGLTLIGVTQAFTAGSPTLLYLTAECTLVNYGGTGGDKDAFLTSIICNES